MQNKKRLLTTLLLGYGVLMLVLIGLLTVMMILSNDILYNNTIVPALDILITVIDVFAYAISATVLIYAIYMYGVKENITLYAAYLCITVFHYVAMLCIGWLILPGTLPETIQGLLGFLWTDVLLFVLLDCLRIFLIVFITAKLLQKHNANRIEYNRKANILDKEQREARFGLFPFSKFLNFKNPIQVGAFVTAVIYWLTYFFQYLYIDILISAFGIEYIEGLPMQIVYLLLNAVLAGICYCIIVFVLLKFDEKMPKLTN